MFGAHAWTVRKTQGLQEACLSDRNDEALDLADLQHRRGVGVETAMGSHPFPSLFLGTYFDPYLLLGCPAGT